MKNKDLELLNEFKRILTQAVNSKDCYDIIQKNERAAENSNELPDTVSELLQSNQNFQDAFFENLETEITHNEIINNFINTIA